MRCGRIGRKADRTRHGYTLMELLVVLVILGLIAALVAPQVIGYLGGAKHDAARMQVDRLAGILDLYYLDTGGYPPGDPGLAALVSRPEGVSGWNGPYLRKAESLIDPWGNPYLYTAPGEHGAYDLSSPGADGRPGGEGENADITSW